MILSATREGVKQQVDVNEAIEVIDELVLAAEGRHLESPEKIVIKAAWLDVDYKEIKENTPYDLGLLQRRVAPKLWVLLTGILGKGEKVTKKRLRSILERKIALPSDSFGDTSNQLEIPISRLPKLRQSAQKVMGGQPPDTSSFYGRTEELKKLKQAVIKQRCVVLTGAIGIGKSALAAKLVEILKSSPEFGFDCVIWKSVAYAPLIQDLVTELIELTNVLEAKSNLPEYTQAKISVLLEHLRRQRCLLVLDAVEAISPGNNSNLPSQQRMEYEIFFRRLTEEQHQSCLLLTSQVQLEELTLLESAKRPIQFIKLVGLELEDAMQLLQSKGLTDIDKCEKLIQTYRGNPSELEAVAKRIQHFFGGNTQKFVERQTTFVSPQLQTLLNQLFEHSKLLSKLQRQVMIYLAQSNSEKVNFVSFTQLIEDLSREQKTPVSTSELMAALESLEARSLIETAETPDTKEISFSLQPTVKKYISTDPLGLVQKSNTAVKPA